MKRCSAAVLLLPLLTLATTPGFAGGIKFTPCPAEAGTTGQFADCTQATCAWDGKSRTMSCSCVVRENVPSVTAKECQPGSSSALQSRYPGVAQMGICRSATNNWADCLRVTCDPDEAGATQCSCNVTSSEKSSARKYVVVGVSKKGAAAACSAQVYYSSATPGSVFKASFALGSETPKVSWVYP